MQADKTMIAEIANALTLHYYSNIETAAGDYVILTPNGASTTTSADDKVMGFAETALIAAYGEDWETVLALKYNGWTDDGLLDLVAKYTKAELDSVAASSFIQESSPEGLMSAVSGMTGLVSEVISTSNMGEATNRLNTLLGPDNHTVSTLTKLEMDTSDPNYSTVVSNLLVSEMANMMQSAENTDNNVMGVLLLYSSAFAYAESTGDTSVLDQMDSNLQNITYEQLASAEYADYVLDGVGDLDSAAKYDEFFTTNQENDTEALTVMMEAVSKISESYSDLESLSNADLYASPEVAEQVNNYVSSVKALADMDAADRTALQNLPAGSVVIFIDKSGVVTVTPVSAWIQP